MPGYARPITTVLSTEVVTQPTGDISATSLQPALAEIASEKLPVSIIDAKGDLIVGSANDTAARLPIAADGAVLAASAAASGGMAWTNSPTITTLRTTNMQHPSASVPAITLDSAGAMTGSFPSPNRNLLYNGAIQVAQRATSASGLTGSIAYNTVDRWGLGLVGLGTWTQSIENDAPTGSGFRKSLRMLCTTANVAPGATAIHYINQALEGQDVQRIAKGTASAQKLTASFWVKSNVTGTYVVTLEDIDNSRNVSASYNISSSATWERKTVTFPEDTTGVLDNDNAGSLKIGFGLGAGSNYTAGTLQTSWGSGYSSFLTGQVNVGSATNNYWQITGIQLETGSVATPFEFKSYGQELAQCQRYYYKTPSSISYRANPSGGSFNMRQTGFFPVAMRTAPNISIILSQIGNQNCTTSAFTISTNSVNFEAATPNSTAWGNPHYDVQYEASAEL